MRFNESGLAVIGEVKQAMMLYGIAESGVTRDGPYYVVLYRMYMALGVSRSYRVASGLVVFTSRAPDLVLA